MKPRLYNWQGGDIYWYTFILPFSAMLSLLVNLFCHSSILVSSSWHLTGAQKRLSWLSNSGRHFSSDCFGKRPRRDNSWVISKVHPNLKHPPPSALQLYIMWGIFCTKHLNSEHLNISRLEAPKQGWVSMY